MAIRRRPRRPTHRTLSREDELAFVICKAVHDAGCACERGSPETCSKMLWAAKRVERHIAEREP